MTSTDATATTTTVADTSRAPRVAWSDAEGAAMVETAFVFILFFSVLWAILSYGMIFALDHTMNGATSEAARAAVSTSDDATAKAAALSVLDQQLATLGTNAANVVVSPPVIADCAAPAGARCITVTIQYPWGAAPIVPVLMGWAAPDTITSTSTIQLSD